MLYSENEKLTYEEHAFTTKTALPSVGTISLESRTSSMLKLSALILDDGGETPSEAGFYYSLSEGCDTGSAYRIAGKMTGNGFSAEISGLSRVTEYHVRAYAVNSAGPSYGQVLEFSTESPPNLSKDGSANCYIISESGIYTFDAVKGNSAESVGEVKSVEVLWESFGTSVAPKSGDLIKSVSNSMVCPQSWSDLNRSHNG